MLLSPGDREAGVWVLAALVLAVPVLSISYVMCGGRWELALPLAATIALVVRRTALWLSARAEARHEILLEEALYDRAARKWKVKP